MVFFNYATKEITAKIVYYGPGLCGKTTNLEYIHANVPEHSHGKFISLATKTDRTLFFDLLPVELGTIRGMKTRLQLYTVPGQVFYNSTRKLVLKGVDGVVFVADSQEQLLEANVESYQNLKANLQEYGLRPQDVALVIQFNKRDLPNILPVEVLNERINELNSPIFESVATTGIGVQETLRGITKLVLNKLAEQQRADARGTPTRSADLSRQAPPAVPAGLIAKERAPSAPVVARGKTPASLPSPKSPTPARLPPSSPAPIPLSAPPAAIPLATPPRAFPALATKAIPVVAAPVPEPPRSTAPKFDFQDEELDSFLNAGLAIEDTGETAGEPTVHITPEALRDAATGRGDLRSSGRPPFDERPASRSSAPSAVLESSPPAPPKPAAGQSVWDMWKSSAAPQPVAPAPVAMELPSDRGRGAFNAEASVAPETAPALSEFDDPFGAVSGADPFGTGDPFGEAPGAAEGFALVGGADDPFGDVGDPFGDTTSPFDVAAETAVPVVVAAPVEEAPAQASELPSNVRDLASLHPDDWISALSPEAPPLAAIAAAATESSIDATAALPASARPMKALKAPKAEKRKGRSFKEKVAESLGDDDVKEEKIDFRAMLQDELDKEGDPFFSPHLAAEEPTVTVPFASGDGEPGDGATESYHDDETVTLEPEVAAPVLAEAMAEEPVESPQEAASGFSDLEIDQAVEAMAPEPEPQAVDNPPAAEPELVEHVPAEPEPEPESVEVEPAPSVEAPAIELPPVEASRGPAPAGKRPGTGPRPVVDPFELEVTEHLKALASRKPARPDAEPPASRAIAKEKKVEREIELYEMGADIHDVELEVELEPTASSVNPREAGSQSAWEEPAVARDVPARAPDAKKIPRRVEEPAIAPPVPVGAPASGDALFEVVRDVEVPVTLSIPEGADRIVLRLSLKIELKRS